MLGFELFFQGSVLDFVVPELCLLVFFKFQKFCSPTCPVFPGLEVWKFHDSMLVC